MKYTITIGEYITDEKTQKDIVANSIVLVSDQIRSGSDVVKTIYQYRNEYIMEKYICNNIAEVENDMAHLERSDDTVRICNLVLKELKKFPLPNMLNSEEMKRFVDPFRSSRVFFKIQ